MGKKNNIKQGRKKARSKQNNQLLGSTSPPNLLTSINKDHYMPTGENNLFDNPMTRAAISALSDEDKARYKEIGEHLYGRINFENGKSINNMPPPMTEAVAYIETQLRSGFHPSMMEDNEKELMIDAYGSEWYKEWGYIKEDLEEIVTLKPILKNYLE